MEGLSMNPEFGNSKFEGIVEENKNGLPKDHFKLPFIKDLPPVNPNKPKAEFEPLDIKELPPL